MNSTRGFPDKVFSESAKICGVIPVRSGSSRFPEKGLAILNGKEIVLHVFERARTYLRFARLIVATDDRRIKDLIESHGGEVFFSPDPYRNGSERAAAAIANSDCDICVDIQGDEVFITSEIIDRTVAVLENNTSLPVATAAFPIIGESEVLDRNLVKVTVDESGRAIIFSRKPITNNGDVVLKNFGHAGIYAYRREFLLKYTTLPQTPGEIAESLEQLRILESGYQMGVAFLDRPLISINTPDDLILASKALSAERGEKS